MGKWVFAQIVSDDFGQSRIGSKRSPMRPGLSETIRASRAAQPRLSEVTNRKSQPITKLGTRLEDYGSLRFESTKKYQRVPKITENKDPHLCGIWRQSFGESFLARFS
jgi:hypothetical protein